MTDLERAKAVLSQSSYTCVLCKADTVYKSERRGVAPLLQWLDGGVDVRGFAAADRVVGKATAYLYCLMGVKTVYAGVMSASAAKVLEAYGIPASWDCLTDGIMNRQKDGLCPMEAATWDCNTPQEALAAVRAALTRLQQK